MTQKETEYEIHSIGSFIRTGLFVLSIVLIASLSVAYEQNHMQKNPSISTADQTTTKKLPIYCVDKKEKDIALSFDAAWGDSRSLKKNRKNSLEYRKYNEKIKREIGCLWLISLLLPF